MRSWQRVPRLVVDDRVGQDANALDLDLDEIAGNHVGHAGRRAGRYDVAHLERHVASDELEELRRPEDEVGRARVLLDDAVETRDQSQVARVEPGPDDRPQRTEAVEALRPGPLPVLLL